MIMISFLICAVVASTTAAYRPSIYDTHGSGVSTASDAAVTRYINKRDGTVAPPRKEAKPIHRPKWGVDNASPCEYWFDDRIHTLGNHGFWGALHAAMAPMSTKLIDLAAYDGIDIRKQLSNELSSMIGRTTKRTSGFRVVDLCCGVGFSTRALRDAFPQPDSTVIGVDTSPQMVAMAQFITDHIATLSVTAKKHYNSMKRQGHNVLRPTRNAQERATTVHHSIQYMLRNAEDTQLPNKSCDLVTVMYAFHEAPHQGREKILKEARRLLAPGGVLAVVDISTEYTPSPNMLLGEPYVQEYQRNIHRQLANIAGFERPKYKDIVPDHLGMWTLKRSASMA